VAAAHGFDLKGYCGRRAHGFEVEFKSVSPLTPPTPSHKQTAPSAQKHKFERDPQGSFFCPLERAGNFLLRSRSRSRSCAAAIPPKPCVATQTGPEGASARPLDSRAFYCWKIEAAQGWNGHVSAATVFAAKCRRLGGSRISGFEPSVSNHSFGVTSERDLLAFTPNLSIPP